MEREMAALQARVESLEVSLRLAAAALATRHDEGDRAAR